MKVVSFLVCAFLFPLWLPLLLVLVVLEAVEAHFARFKPPRYETKHTVRRSVVDGGYTETTDWRWNESLLRPSLRCGACRWTVFGRYRFRSSRPSIPRK